MANVVIGSQTYLLSGNTILKDESENVTSVTLLIPLVSGVKNMTKSKIVKNIEQNGVSSIEADDGTITELSNFKFVSSVSEVDGDFYLGTDDEGNELRATGTINVNVLSNDSAEETLNEIKSAKIAEMSKICHDTISNGVDVELSDKTTEHFGYDDDDRSNIKEMFDAVVMGATGYPYHKDGGSCKTYSKADIIAIYVAEVTNKTHHTTYFNQLKQYIGSLTSMSDISDITYGTELTGTYKEVYDANMAEAAAQLEIIIGKIG